MLQKKILAAWSEGSTIQKEQAERDVSGLVPISRWLYSSHGSDREQDRLLYMRYYILALYSLGGGNRPSEKELLHLVAVEEKKYLEEMKRRADERGEALRPHFQLTKLREWARKQPMNPADHFEAGIAYYDITSMGSNRDWVENDIVDISQRDYTVTISYRKGTPLRFPTQSIDFEHKYAGSIEELFVRRHKASGRLIPFAIYKPGIDLYMSLPEIDALSLKDRTLMALPRFDTGLTPTILSFYSSESAWWQGSRWNTKTLCRDGGRESEHWLLPPQGLLQEV